MLSNPKLASAVRLALVSSAATAALYAPATFAADEQTMEVTVTGTRISKPDLESNSPITTVTAEAIEQLNTVNLEGQLRQMPQFLPGSTEYINNGNPGAATINLRGLGSNRTLVLMDGKRLPPFGTSGAVDINLIPAALIERIDIVTGGASAVYGSDAVSGVVNFVTKKNFEGLQLDANTSQYGKGDGQTTSGAITAGGKFADDRGSAVLSFSYTKRDPVLQGARAYSNYYLNPGQYGIDIQDPGRRGGSSNAGATRASLQVSAGARGNRHFTPDGQLLSAGATNATQYGPNRFFNYNPYNYFQVPQTRWSAMGSLNFQLTDSAEIYGRVFAVNGSVPTQLAPSAYFGGSTAAFQLNVDNPFLSVAQRTGLIGIYNNEAANGLHGGTPYSATAAAGSQTVNVNGLRRRLPELGNRFGISESKTFQISGGVRGDIGETGWNYDVSAQWGRVSRLDGLENDVNIERAQQALLAIQTPTGIQCLNTAGGCAPANLFNGNGALDPSTGIPMTGAISADALTFIRANYYSAQTTEAHSASASISGEIDALKSPMADSPVSLAFGMDWNEYTAAFRPDDLTQFGGAMGQGGTAPPLSGAVDSKEFFGEAYIPLVSGKPGVENLALELGYRYADTNLAGSFGTWKAGLEWTPVQSLRVRAMAQRAVRAPNIGEQFAPKSFGLTEINSDPCAGAVVANDVWAKCLAQGAINSQRGLIDDPAAQQAASIGGGAVANGFNLAPEEADTYTFGVQYTPEALPGFNASVDYYDIKIKQGIGSYGAQEIVNNCFVGNLSNFCGLIKRNSLGALEGDGFGIVLDTRNLASLGTKGIDYSVGYNFELSEFKISTSLMGSHTTKWEFKSSPASPVITCEGLYGDTCGNPTPKDRINLSVGVDWRSFSATVFVRHLSAVTIDNPGVYEIEKIKAFDYVDLSLQWKWDEKLKVTLAAQNLLDKDPTVVGNIPGANTSMNAYADTYDPLGTRYSLGVSYKF